MKKFYLSFMALLMAFAVHAQNTSHNIWAATVGDTAIYIEFDYGDNCPEEGSMNLVGTPALGFHSGANTWAATVAWDSATAEVMVNDSSDNFRVLIDPEDYYGVPLAGLSNIEFVANNGVANPGGAWDEGFTGRDSTNGSFGGNETDCSNLIVIIDSIAPFPLTSRSVTACKDSTNGYIQIKFNYAQNCPEAGKGLSGVDTIGFHSGANTWSSVVAWDDSLALPAVNNGLDTFTVTLNPLDYYGIPLSQLMNVKMVYNNGPNDSISPWDLAGRADVIDPVEQCEDLHVEMMDAGYCDLSEFSTGIADLKLDINVKVKPNPFSQSALVSFNNYRQELLDIQLTNINGQMIRTWQVRGNELEISANDLSNGIYFLTIRNQEGKYTSQKLMVN